MFGSFLNVCIYRMPRGMSVAHPRRSFCPACQGPVAAYDNLPVLSWIMLRGRCRLCKTRISPRYAIVELLTAIFFTLSYETADSPAATLRFCVFSFLLIGLIFTDAETKLLPDLLTKPGLAAGLAFSLFAPVEGPAQALLGWGNAPWRVLSLLNSLAGAALGAGFILGVALLYQAVRKVEGMGMGDVKLMGMIGAFLGIKMTLLVLLTGSVIGSVFGISLILMVWRKRWRRLKNRRLGPVEGAATRAWNSARLIYRNFEIPFGVFLGLAAVFVAFWGTPVVRWYLHFFE